MGKVVRSKGPTKRKRGRHGRKATKVNLTKVERPTGRADVFPDDNLFEKKLEQINIDEIEIEFSAIIARIRTKIHADPRSPAVLAISGCLCLLTLHVTGAPEWAQLGGLVLPWAISLIWVVCRVLS